jgi:hypothetical protein
MHRLSRSDRCDHEITRPKLAARNCFSRFPAPSGSSRFLMYIGGLERHGSPGTLLPRRQSGLRAASRERTGDAVLSVARPELALARSPRDATRGACDLCIQCSATRARSRKMPGESGPLYLRSDD